MDAPSDARSITGEHCIQVAADPTIGLIIRSLNRLLAIQSTLFILLKHLRVTIATETTDYEFKLSFLTLAGPNQRSGMKLLGSGYDY